LYLSALESGLVPKSGEETVVEPVVVDTAFTVTQEDAQNVRVTVPVAVAAADRVRVLELTTVATVVPGAMPVPDTLIPATTPEKEAALTVVEPATVATPLTSMHEEAQNDENPYPLPIDGAVATSTVAPASTYSEPDPAEPGREMLTVVEPAVVDAEVTIMHEEVGGQNVRVFVPVAVAAADRVRVVAPTEATVVPGAMPAPETVIPVNRRMLTLPGVGPVVGVTSELT
jgi:hypothetical protein